MIKEEERNKRFDGLFNSLGYDCITGRDKIKRFIQSEIDLAIADREKELVNKINKKVELKIFSEAANKKLVMFYKNGVEETKKTKSCGNLLFYREHRTTLLFFRRNRRKSSRRTRSGI